MSAGPPPLSILTPNAESRSIDAQPDPYVVPRAHRGRDEFPRLAGPWPELARDALLPIGPGQGDLDVDDPERDANRGRHRACDRL